MNSMHLARAAYGQPETPVRSNRQIEYDLFARITKHLTEAGQARATDHPAFVKALHANLTLWHTLASDVAGSANGLPPKLRAQLFYLYEFTAEHSRKILADGAGHAVLLDINTAVMRGLRGEGDSL